MHLSFSFFTLKKKFLVFILLFLFTFSNVSAQENIKVMFYNLLNYPLEDAVPNRINDLSYILGDYQPDLFLVCELNNSTGANTILDTTKAVINSNFEMATFVTNTSDDAFGDQNDLQNLIYFDSTKFSLEEQIIVPSQFRDFNVYRLLLNTVDKVTNPIELYVVVCHLKASSGTYNAQKRYEMVLDLETYLDTLPADVNVLLGGDLNLYRSSEDAFQELISTNNQITFTDPANRIGSWNNNLDYIDVFTQSTRTETGLGGANGGFDDRFDFLLTSENLLSTANITYIPDSYKAFGNNGLASCWNKSINASECGTTSSEFSYTLRNALHNFSDHLPVTLSLEIASDFLSVDDFKVSSGIHLEETVVTSTLVLNIDNALLFNQPIVIYNNLGQKIKTFQMTSDTKQYFNVSDLPTGMFYLSVPTHYSNPIKFIISN
jgi:endonuclease/exonuclease/phosphatase family metal-dependent hydrolase